jgi:uncharacterized protein YbjT (DUF2867 family)
MSRPTTVLVVGATGSIGRLAVEEALRQGYRTKALVRDAGRAQNLAKDAEVVVGDLTRPETLAAAVADVDAVVFTHGSGGGRGAAEAVDYGGVRNVLTALGNQPARIALMTSIGVTNRAGSYNQSTQIHDWKRRSERLVRASGRPYTIVRPGWFDDNDPDQLRLVALQGDTRHAGNSSDGVVSRRQIAEVLVSSLDTASAENKTLELVAEPGPATTDFDKFFGALEADTGIDGVRDSSNMALPDEPQQVREDLDRLSQQR